MRLTDEGLRNKTDWEEHGVRLPAYDRAAMRAGTLEAPVWIHFGAGNIFRGFIAGLQQRLLDAGLADRGLIAAETFDGEIIDRIYKPWDSLTLMVSLKPDGGTDREVIASLAGGFKASSMEETDWGMLKQFFEAPTLQMVSFTITEKGYALLGHERCTAAGGTGGPAGWTGKGAACHGHRDSAAAAPVCFRRCAGSPGQHGQLQP